MLIYYKTFDKYLVRSVKIVWSNHTMPFYSMQKEDDLWKADITVPKGEHLYHFLINDSVFLNDPEANFYLPDTDGRLWSVLLIDKDGNRLFNNNQYSVEVKSYSITNRVIKDQELQYTVKRAFNTLLDSLISLRIDFINVTGYHTVTVLWMDPSGGIFASVENYLNPTDDQDNILEPLWFNLDLRNTNYSYLHGHWKIKIFLDGIYILEEYIQLGQGTTYTKDGLLQINI